MTLTTATALRKGNLILGSSQSSQPAECTLTTSDSFFSPLISESEMPFCIINPPPSPPGKGDSPLLLHGRFQSPNLKYEGPALPLMLLFDFCTKAQGSTTSLTVLMLGYISVKTQLCFLGAKYHLCFQHPQQSLFCFFFLLWMYSWI